MTREEIIRNLKYTMKKHENDTVNTFDTNISVMCKDILDYFEEQEPCEKCDYVEGSPFCLQYCPYDAERKKEQEPTVQDKQAESEKYQKAFDDGYANGYAQARFDYEQEPTFDDECQKDMDEAWEQIQKKRKRIPVTLDLTPCDDAISREYLKKIAQSEGAYGYVSAYDIATAPSVTQKQKTGHWIIIDDCEQFIAKCSKCGRIEDSRMISKYPYCHCGAYMVEPQESEG